MPSYDKVLLMGHLTRDIEVRATKSGTSVANFGVAVNRKFKDREEAVFFDCEAWGNTGETIAKYLGKGDPIFVEGHHRLDQWEKDGQKFSKLRVVVERFEFIGGKSSSPAGEWPPRKAANAGRAVFDDPEVPF